jgi:hypothetical protein
LCCWSIYSWKKSGFSSFFCWISPLHLYCSVRGKTTVWFSLTELSVFLHIYITAFFLIKKDSFDQEKICLVSFTIFVENSTVTFWKMVTTSKLLLEKIFFHSMFISYIDHLYIYALKWLIINTK